MPTPNEKLATSLAALEAIQKKGRRVIRSAELVRVHRERLLKNGFLREVMKGWYISSSPTTNAGDTTPWYASFWEFCARYCDARFGDKWHLSPQQSLLLHAENTVVPPQVVIYTPKGGNNTVKLQFGNSLYDLSQNEMLAKTDLVERKSIRLYTLEAALIKVPQAFFTQHPIEAQTALALVRDASDVLNRLLDGGHSAAAGRLAGAFRRIGRSEVADEILHAMKAADYDIREIDPFERDQDIGVFNRTSAPIVGRLEASWELFRAPIIAAFPEAPGLPQDQSAYLRLVDDIYTSDAYNSLSIEGYQVTPALIERVRSGRWDPAKHEEDRQNRDALAARGYWQAFQSVRDAIGDIIAGNDAGKLVSRAHRDWHRELFQPCVAAGIIEVSALAGYRNHAVFIRGSQYVPPRWEAVRDAMPALFDLLQNETETSVRAVLGHWLIGYIHPYPDGNGRMARFVMNAMLASGGYPWTVIQQGDHQKYMAALEAASVDQNIKPFARFLATRVKRSMKQKK